VRPAAVDGAAFFDLDRTLLSSSSSLALAGSFRRRGLLSRRQLVQAAVAQFVFVRFGAGQSRVGQTAESAMEILKGLPVAELRAIVEEAWGSVLRPLVYREAVDLAADHAARGERRFVVSAALQEVVDTVATGLGFDGGIGSRAEVVDGAYTGRLERRLFGSAKAEALAELAAAEGIDLAASTGYSDSHTDLPFLEAVGRPVAVNPDRALRRAAQERGWPVRRFRDRLGTA
jgi:HAD superfamily hydrolase (TIGR01490 family)